MGNVKIHLKFSSTRLCLLERANGPDTIYLDHILSGQLQDVCWVYVYTIEITYNQLYIHKLSCIWVIFSFLINYAH